MVLPYQTHLCWRCDGSVGVLGLLLVGLPRSQCADSVGMLATQLILLSLELPAQQDQNVYNSIFALAMQSHPV